MTSRSELDHANHYTIETSYKKGQTFHVESYNVLLFWRVKIKMHVSYNERSLLGLAFLVFAIYLRCLLSHTEQFYQYFSCFVQSELQRKKPAISMLLLRSVHGQKTGHTFIPLLTDQREKTVKSLFCLWIWYKSLSISDNDRKLCFDNSTRFSIISTYLFTHCLS
jgi:hypothetical protein